METQEEEREPCLSVSRVRCPHTSCTSQLHHRLSALGTSTSPSESLPPLQAGGLWGMLQQLCLSSEITPGFSAGNRGSPWLGPQNLPLPLSYPSQGKLPYWPTLPPALPTVHGIAQVPSSPTGLPPSARPKSPLWTLPDRSFWVILSSFGASIKNYFPMTAEIQYIFVSVYKVLIRHLLALRGNPG